MKIKVLEENEQLNESSINRILSHLQTNNIATITSYVTSDDDRRTVRKKKQSNNQNKKMNQKLAQDLKRLGYSFTRVDGEYTVRGYSEPFSEKSFFVICPDGYDLDQFTDDMKNLAKKYEQESVIVWSYVDHEAVLYGTDDFVRYVPWQKFNNFSMKTMKIAWTKFKNHWFRFVNDGDDENTDEHYILESEYFENEMGNDVPVYRISHYRQELFGKWY